MNKLARRPKRQTKSNAGATLLVCFNGVPITIKEQFLVKGTATTFGVLHQKNHLSGEDGPLVKRLRDAGAIVLGKTNTSQLLIYIESDNPVYGRTNNPWNLERTCGGSSGGEAAIIATGGSPLGLGADMGGQYPRTGSFLWNSWIQAHLMALDQSRHPRRCLSYRAGSYLATTRTDGAQCG